MNRAHTGHQVVIAGAGYAGLHVAQRLGTRLEKESGSTLTLVDQNDYHQVLTELPRVAAGNRSAEAVRVPLATVLNKKVDFVRSRITGFDLAGHLLQTEQGPLPYTRLVLALGSRPNDFGIPGLAERALTLWSVEDAGRVLETVQARIVEAAGVNDAQQQHRLLTVVIGGGGATGVELAGELAEEMPLLARRLEIPENRCRVVLVEAGATILAGSSPELIARANEILAELGVVVHTNALIAQVTAQGFVLKSGETLEGGVFVWAGGVKAPDLVKGSGLPIGYNGRIKVDQYLRVLDHPDIYVAGDLASVVDFHTGRVLPPLAQTALAEGETVAHNLWAEMTGGEPETFNLRTKGFIVSVGAQSGVAEVGGHALGGRLAHALKDAVEWEYRNSVKHLRGWSPL